MFAEELSTRKLTYVPTRIDLVPAIVSPIFFNRVSVMSQVANIVLKVDEEKLKRKVVEYVFQ